MYGLFLMHLRINDHHIIIILYLGMIGVFMQTGNDLLPGMPVFRE